MPNIVPLTFQFHKFKVHAPLSDRRSSRRLISLLLKSLSFSISGHFSFSKVPYCCVVL
ncbi:hypothetical protein IC582_017284 [Cucumis melo]